MTILDNIDTQLQFLTGLLRRDINKNSVVYDYYVNEPNLNILDWVELRNFLTVKKLAKTNHLIDLVLRAEEFIELWNSFDNSIIKKFDENFIYKSKYGFGNTSFYFRMISITNKQIMSLPNRSDILRHKYLNKYPFKLYNLHDFTIKCNKIRGIILNYYPEIGTILKLDDVEKNVKNHDPLKEKQKSANLTITKELSENEVERNDFIKSTIEDYLDPIKMYFKTEDYDLLVKELESYFKTGAFTNSKDIIKTVNRPNMKLIGWHLKELYNNCLNDNTKLSIEYLKFGKQRISIFKNVLFDESNYLKSNLYKYYNTKVKNT